MSASAHIIELNEENFIDVVVEGSEKQPVLVDFWADWCGPCKSLMPVLEKLAIEFDGGFVLAKLDTEAHPGIAQQLGIRSLPTVKLFKNKQLIDEFMGALPEPDVRKFLESHDVKSGDDEAEADDATMQNPVVAQAMMLFEQGDSQGAREILQQAQATDPANEDILLALGQICVSTGDLDTAASCLKALPEDSQNSTVANRLAGTLELAKEADTSKSVSELQSELAANPDDSNVRYQLAIATALAGDVQSGMDGLLEMVQRDADYNDGAPRKKLLALFNVLGEDPLAGQYRRKLFALLH